MKKLLFIAPGVADFGHGILLTVLVIHLFGVEPAIWHFVLGLLFSVLPDLDGSKEFFHYGKIDAGEHGDHRDGLHYPLVWAIIGVILIFINPFIGTLFTLCVLTHFFNDSWGTGWGVEWLWPFSNKSYKLFSQNNVDADTSCTSLVTSWEPEAKNETAKRLSNANWLEDVYGRITIISAIEYGTFLIALLVLFLYLWA
jgi:hypothetical protein